MLSLSLLPYAAGVAAILAVAGWLYWRGRSSANADVAAARAKASAAAREIENGVAARTAADNRERLAKWSKP